MKRKPLVIIAVALVLIMLFIAVRLWPHSCADGISHGTVVIASIDKDSIVIAADSRETDIAFSEKKITFTDTRTRYFVSGILSLPLQA